MSALHTDEARSHHYNRRVVVPSSSVGATPVTATTHTKLTTGQVGAAGEHYVAMRLAMNGMDAAIPPSGNPITDVIAHIGGRTRSIQVKTRRHGRAPMIDMQPDKVAQADFVVIVLLGEARGREGDVPPTAYVLPHHTMMVAWERFGYTHPKRCNMRLDYDWLAPFHEAWHLVADDLTPPP